MESKFQIHGQIHAHILKVATCHVLLTRHRIWIDKWIYWTFVTCDYVLTFLPAGYSLTTLSTAAHSLPAMIDIQLTLN
jgi:hypothetical protein